VQESGEGVCVGRECVWPGRGYGKKNKASLCWKKQASHWLEPCHGLLEFANSSTLLQLYPVGKIWKDLLERAQSKETDLDVK